MGTRRLECLPQDASYLSLSKDLLLVVAHISFLSVAGCNLFASKNKLRRLTARSYVRIILAMYVHWFGIPTKQLFSPHPYNPALDAPYTVANSAAPHHQFAHGPPAVHQEIFRFSINCCLNHMIKTHSTISPNVFILPDVSYKISLWLLYSSHCLTPSSYFLHCMFHSTTANNLATEPQHATRLSFILVHAHTSSALVTFNRYLLPAYALRWSWSCLVSSHLVKWTKPRRNCVYSTHKLPNVLLHPGCTFPFCKFYSTHSCVCTVACTVHVLPPLHSSVTLHFSALLRLTFMFLSIIVPFAFCLCERPGSASR